MRSVAALLYAATLCCDAGAQQDAKQAEKALIKVGAVSSIAVFPEATAAVRAYFDTVNAAGGVRGRKLQLIVEDDKGQPEAAARSARKLVEQDQVVANVGSASTLECAVNGPYYAERALVSIQGTGVDPTCFSSSNIAPVNTGPYGSLAVALKFLSDIRQRNRICVVTLAYATSLRPAFERIVAEWQERTGRKLAYAAFGRPLTEDPAVQIKAALDARCDGIVFPGLEPAVIAWVKTAKALKAEGIDWVFLTPAYTKSAADTLKTEGEGIFAISEFEPWSSRSGMLTDWRNMMVRGSVPLTSFSQGGYVAASVFVSVLRGINGEINRESVTRAFKTMRERRVPLMGTPFSFGDGAQHNPNRAAVPVRLEAGKWVVAHYDYIEF